MTDFVAAHRALRQQAVDLYPVITDRNGALVPLMPIEAQLKLVAWWRENFPWELARRESAAAGKKFDLGARKKSELDPALEKAHGGWPYYKPYGVLYSIAGKVPGGDSALAKSTAIDIWSWAGKLAIEASATGSRAPAVRTGFWALVRAETKELAGDIGEVAGSVAATAGEAVGKAGQGLLKGLGVQMAVVAGGALAVYLAFGRGK